MPGEPVGYISQIMLPNGQLYNLKDSSAVHNLVFDNAPIENSTNPVKSGGIYSSIEQVRSIFSSTDISIMEVD